MQIRSIILLIIFLIPCISLAQTGIISGNITDKDGVLPSATIQLKSVKNLQLLFYGFTDPQGSYAINGTLDDSPKFLLIAAYMGYKRDTMVLDRVQILKQNFKHNFILHPDAKQLKEVYIKAPPAIQINNDTTKYNIQRFSSPDDRNLESVLKKMPGMEVNKDGTIFFKGKKISKILLEGDDLTGEGYKILTKNLKPEQVEEVQAIENFVEDGLLKGIINSDDIVLNLKVKNKKQQLIGNVDAGMGTNNRRDFSTNLITFKNKTKAFAFARHSNLSNDFSNNLLNLVDEDRKFGASNEIIKHDIGSYNPFDATLYTINTTTSGSLNAITRINKDLKINYSIFYSVAQLNAQNTILNNYFPPNSISTEDIDHRTSNNKTLKADFSADYLVKKNSRLWAKFSYRQAPKTFQSMAYSTFNSIMGDSVLQHQQDLNKTFNGEMKYTLQSNKSTAFVFSGKVWANHIEQSYQTESSLYSTSTLFNGVNQLVQEVENHHLKIKIDGEVLKRYGEIFLYGNIGEELTDFQLKTQLYSNSNSEFTALDERFKNDNSYKASQSYALGKFIYDNKVVKVQAQLKAAMQFLSNFGKDSSFFMLQPSISFTFKPSEIQRIALNYNYKNTMPEPLEYYRNYILTDIRSLSSSLQNFYSYNTHLLGLNYNYNDFMNSYFSFNFSLNGSYSRYGFLYTSFFNDAFYYTEKQPYKGLKTFGSNLNVKKFIPALALTLTANYGPSASTYYGKLANEIKPYSTLTHVFQLRTNTGFNLPVNFAAAFELIKTRTNSEGQLVAQNSAYKYTMEARYKFNDSWHSTSAFNLYRMNNQNFNLLDTELQHSPKKGIFKYSLQGKNLTNLKSFTNISISEAASSSYSSTILGRYILLNISMSIK